MEMLRKLGNLHWHEKVEVDAKAALDNEVILTMLNTSNPLELAKYSFEGPSMNPSVEPKAKGK